MDVLLNLPTLVNSTEKEIPSPLRSFFFQFTELCNGNSSNNFV